MHFKYISLAAFVCVWQLSLCLLSLPQRTKLPYKLGSLARLPQHLSVHSFMEAEIYIPLLYPTHQFGIQSKGMYLPHEAAQTTDKKGTSWLILGNLANKCKTRDDHRSLHLPSYCTWTAGANTYPKGLSCMLGQLTWVEEPLGSLAQWRHWINANFSSFTNTGSGHCTTRNP